MQDTFRKCLTLVSRFFRILKSDIGWVVFLMLLGGYKFYPLPKVSYIQTTNKQTNKLTAFKPSFWNRGFYLFEDEFCRTKNVSYQIDFFTKHFMLSEQEESFFGSLFPNGWKSLYCRGLQNRAIQHTENRTIALLRANIPKNDPSCSMVFCGGCY